MKIPSETIQWLIESKIGYIRYNGAKLFKPGEENPADLINDPFITETVAQLKGWKTEILKQHNKPELYMHRLAMLADLGVTRDFPEIGPH
ncbi:MAG: hypothetical protein JXR70_04310 [Spirochaetales bacterium]|nr:hypothetical protein [Spirochaetales bacterium]